MRDIVAASSGAPKERAACQSTIDPAVVERRARFIRRETVRLIGIAKSGHYTSVFSAAEILAALYSGVMRLRDDPDAGRSATG